MNIIARAGEKVTCENGHEICTFAEDFNRDSVFGVRLFTDWKIERPEPSSPIENCPTCGAQYVRFTDRGPQINIAGEWRPKPVNGVAHQGVEPTKIKENRNAGT